MRIRTKINVDYSVGISPSSFETGIVEGVIDSAGWINNPETDVFDTVGINYKYVDTNGNDLHRDGLTIVGTAELEGLYQAVKGSIPEGLDNASTEQVKFYLSFIQSMAQTFGISPTDIEVF